MQAKDAKWFEQWSMFADNAEYQFLEWIHPFQPKDFHGMRVLDAGCGHGRHIRLVAPHARSVVGADLNTVAIARRETSDLRNVEIVEADLASMNHAEPFDAVYCVGVIHHTDDPDATFRNLKRLTRKGGRLLVWAYADEGNWLVKNLLEPAKRALLLRLSTWARLGLAYALTLLLYPAVYTVYVLPGTSLLPYHDYFRNFRLLPFRRNLLNVFDKLNAPQTHFIRRAQVEAWFNPDDFEDVRIDHYRGVSWRCSGARR